MSKRRYRTDVKGRIYSVIALIILLAINLAGLYFNGSRILFISKSDKITMRVEDINKKGEIKVRYLLANNKPKYAIVNTQYPERYKSGTTIYGYMNIETKEIKPGPDIELSILEKGVHTIFFVLLVLYIIALIYGEISIRKHQKKIARFK